MSESNKYPVSTIFEMAAIPEEAFPRFVAELPEIVRSFRQMQEISKELEGFGAELLMQTPVWIDDDKCTGKITIKHDGQELACVKYKYPPKGAE